MSIENAPTSSVLVRGGVAWPGNVLWGKSDAGGRPHPLVGHLLDCAAVAEIIWDSFMAPAVKRRLDSACDGRGRDVFVLACGWHDLGKATPQFQAKVVDLGQEVIRAGLVLPPTGQPWHHSKAGAAILRAHKAGLGPGLEWLIPLVEGHHGRFSGVGDYRRAPRDAHAPTAQWEQVQAELMQWVLDRLDFDPATWHCTAPDLATQLALAGLVSMADWIASSDAFPGLPIEEISLERARQRARAAWESLHLHGGWAPDRLRQNRDLFAARFGQPARPVQDLVMAQALAMPSSGLLIVEAPMGEGKTEAAFVAAEILAARFGADGFVFAMPTQGTTDVMYDRCCHWARAVDPDTDVALLHGKAMANEVWRQRLEHVAVTEIGDLDIPDPYGVEAANPAGARPYAEWLLGRYRGLLTPWVVGTVDQVLYAATRTKYVALRYAGLSGKVVIIDEVHSYDIYMSQFLHALLRWCGTAAVPVVLMSATLAPAMREELATAYASGLAENPSQPNATAATEYPTVRTVLPGLPLAASAGCLPWRPDITVRVGVLEGDTCEDLTALIDAIARDIADGGCALVIVNTVKRAQYLYQGLTSRHDLAADVRLLHGRLTTAARADRTAEIVDLLGGHRTRASGRPARMVVVATQIAEQSFDVDADVLFTDLAPMDLLAQRIGRLHRHDRPVADRPPRLRTPRVVITGMTNGAVGSPPKIADPFGYVYARETLLRSAQLLAELPEQWHIPSDVPMLVARAYADQAPWPVGWEDAAATARADRQAAEARRAAVARTYVLRAEAWARDLAGLHVQSVSNPSTEAAVVRDGEPTREVALLRRMETGLTTLDGTPLGPNGERCTSTAVARRVLGDTVRVRESERIAGLCMPSAWAHVPLLAHQEAIVLDPSSRAEEDPRVTYDALLGLVIDRSGRQ